MFLMVGALVGIGTSLLDPATQNTNLFFVFFCGMVSISGMTLPGLSGSYLLILFGNYVLLMVDSVNAFLNADFYSPSNKEFAMLPEYKQLLLRHHQFPI